MVRVPRLRALRPLDVALAVGCAVAMLLEQAISTKAEPSALSTVAIALACTPVALRHQAPITAFLAAFATLFAVMETTTVYTALPAPVVICAYAVAERRGRRVALVAAAGTLPATLAILQVYSPHPVVSWGTASYLVAVALPFALGVAAHDRRRWTEALTARAEAAERTREEEALRRVGEERLRIARDVHDVVAHAMVTINVQAGVGAHLLDRDPAQAYVTLRTIKQVSGDALTDLRAMLGLLRTDDEPAAHEPPRPVPRLADLAELREGVAAAGLDVTVDIDPAARALPVPVDATCFRIVQEALTNTLRHAGPTTARVRVVREADRVVLEVVDDGGGAPGPLRHTGSGHGLRGMRERATALGGSLEAGPRPEGGWRVAASLPVAPSPGTPSPGTASPVTGTPETVVAS